MSQVLKPKIVAVCALINDNRILLIKRSGGNMAGFWALPGGKVETGEHVSDAAIREIFEESGIKATFKNHAGFISEHLTENGEIYDHTALHICELVSENFDLTETREGKLGWFDLNCLSDFKDELIPSDFHIIDKLLLKREGNYYNSVIDKQGDEQILVKFESD